MNIESIVLKLIERQRKARWAKAKKAAWYLNNRVKVAARGAVHRHANRDKIKARMVVYNKEHHREYTINNWQRRGVKLRPGETWNGVYAKHMATKNCESCDIELDNNCRSTRRNLDHMHKGTHYIRGTICHLCNINDHWQKRMTPDSVYQSYSL